MSHRTALVTGATSGIGLGIATQLAQAGYHLVINGLGNSDDIQQHIHALMSTHGVEVMYSDADISCPESIERMMTQAFEHFGAIDVLVNNAGIQHVSAIETFPPEKWDQIIAINLSAAFHTTRRVIPQMKHKKWGRIVNIASAHARVASPFKSAYVSAKHGLAGLTKTVALETAQAGITCNAICPGYVLTPLVEGQIADTARTRQISPEDVVQDVMLASQPTKRFVTIDEIAQLVVYLCRDDAQSITGALLSMDGGWTAH